MGKPILGRSFSPSPSRGQSVDYGCKGKGVTLNMLVDRKRHPLSAMSGSEKSDDRKMVLLLIKKSNIFVLKDITNLAQTMIFFGS